MLRPRPEAAGAGNPEAGPLAAEEAALLSPALPRA